MIDADRGRFTMWHVGREDRALLRSNPSARTDAGTWTGASPSAGRPFRLIMFWPQSDKPRGLGGRAPKVNPRAVGHMSSTCG